MPEALAYNLNFFHPLLMGGLLALSGYGMVLGIKAKKTRTAEAADRKELIKGQFAKRHFQIGSLILVLMVLGTFGGMAVTYLNNGHDLSDCPGGVPDATDAAGQPDCSQGPCGPEYGDDDPVCLASREWFADPGQDLGETTGLSWLGRALRTGPGVGVGSRAHGWNGSLPAPSR